MDTRRVVNRMNRFRHSILSLKQGVHPDEALWKPSDSDWSILEIVSHMVDTETDDMRTRVRLTLDDPSQPWPPIDPVGWAVERNYQDNDFHTMIDRFVKERTLSVDWLRSLELPDWESTHEMPRLGPIRAGDILAAWCTHDALHLRQIAKRMYQLTAIDVGDYETRYAGEWVA